MTRHLLLVVIFLFTLIATIGGSVEGNEATVGLGNEAIRLVVNNTDDGRGRFAVEVTGGDPTRPDDDGEPLIYGRPIPWTSYTTLRLDGQVYAFGGPTVRRAGKGLPTGEELLPPVIQEGAIRTIWRYGDLEVIQQLSIVEGPTTGQPDTARIAYTFLNRGGLSHRVGLRVVLDTMLGENDGAPFRVGERQILTDEVLGGRAIEPYWQAFDSLEQPRVIAQGTLAGGELVPPDRIYFTNWGTLADAPWEASLFPGRDFTRTGEFELDSAVALLWEERELPPGGSLTFTTYYGLGGVTIAKGELMLGLTAPATVRSEEAHGFLVLAYLENRGRGVAQDVVLRLDLPAGLTTESATRVELGRLRPGESRQVAWTLFPSADRAGVVRLRLTAEALGLAPVTVERELRLVAPARLELTALSPAPVRVVGDRYVPYPLPLAARVANTGGAPLTNAWAEFVPLSGLALAPGEGSYRFLGEIAPGEEVRVEWQVVTGVAGPAGYAVLAGSSESPPARKEAAVVWPALPRLLKAVYTPLPDRPGWWRVDLFLVNSPEAARVDLQLLLGTGRIISIQRGAFFVEEGKVLPWAIPPLEAGGRLTISAVRKGAHGLTETTLASVWLAGTPPVGVAVRAVLDPAGNPLPVNLAVLGAEGPLP
ncbi:MAG: hypothetical protein GX493_04920 [Firmicutes bacterium]|nr:hypothetical protein [Bacillota bacterium]